MNLNEQDINRLKLIANTAKAFDIGSVMVANGGVSAMEEDRTVAIFDPTAGLSIPNAMGLNRIPILQARLAMAEEEGSTITCNIDINNEVSGLIIRSGRMKLDYRCAMTASVLAPKTLDVPPYYKLIIPPDIITMLSKADKAMAAEHLTISRSGGNVVFELKDANNDAFEYDAGALCTSIHADAPDNFSYKYSIGADTSTGAPGKRKDAIRRAFKLNTTSEFLITYRGMFAAKINNMMVYIPSKQ